MNNISLQPWEQIPFSFRFPYFCVWFLGSEGYIDGYTLDYGSFIPLNEAVFKSKIPFNLTRHVFVITCLAHGTYEVDIKR